MRGSKIIVSNGDIFGDLTITREVQRSRKENGKVNYRMVEVKCKCGKVFISKLSPLISGRTLSCGCRKIRSFIERNTKHGMHDTKIYGSWEGMIQRVKNRKNCGVYPPWRVFDNWYKDNKEGWSEGLHFCRNGDTGNYEPNNVRWDTAFNNHQEANALHWEVVSPDRIKMRIFNLRKFCRDNGLSPSCMIRVSKGEAAHHRGWACNKASTIIDI